MESTPLIKETSNSTTRLLSNTIVKGKTAYSQRMNRRIYKYPQNMATNPVECQDIKQWSKSNTFSSLL